MSYETIQYCETGPVARITLNRPEVHNAFNGKMVDELVEVYTQAGHREDLRVVVLSGTGKSFCAGADLNWMREIVQYSYDDNLRESNLISDLMEAIDLCPKATIARVHGATLGGGTGLAATNDLIITSEPAFFSLSEVRIGLVPACISPYVIARVGIARARECFITGERIPAAAAVKIGLATEVTTPENLDDRVEARIRQILKNGPDAIAWAKKLARHIPGMPMSVTKKYTAEIIAGLRISDEGQEGMDAFLNRRKPRWVVDHD